MDPLADKYPGWSSYNYTLNNPINNFDPDGKYVVSDDGRRVSRVTLGSHTFRKNLGYVSGTAVLVGKIMLGDNSYKPTASDYASACLGGMNFVGGVLLNQVRNLSNAGKDLVGLNGTIAEGLMNLGTNLQTETQTKEALLMDREIFNIAKGIGLGTYSTAGREDILTINISKNLSRDQVNEMFEDIKESIEKYLNGRNISDLSEEELKELRTHYRK